MLPKSSRLTEAILLFLNSIKVSSNIIRDLVMQNPCFSGILAGSLDIRCAEKCTADHRNRVEIVHLGKPNAPHFTIMCSERRRNPKHSAEENVDKCKPCK